MDTVSGVRERAARDGGEAPTHRRRPHAQPATPGLEDEHEEPPPVTPPPTRRLDVFA